ncbi:MAG: ABC transporter permease [Anaerolineae bacterium]
MQRILAIAWKDLRVRFASPAEWLFFIILPVFFIMAVSGFASGPNNGDYRITVLAVDEDSSALSRKLLDTLNASDSVRVEPLAAAAAQKAFDDGDGPALLAIPAGFEADLLAGRPVQLDLRLLPVSTNALAAQQAIQAAAGQISRGLAAANSSVALAGQVQPFADDAARRAYFADSLAAAEAQLAAAPARLAVTKPPVEEETEYNGAAQSSAGQLLVWVIIPLLGTAALMAYERTQGTLKRLISTPTSKAEYLLGTITGQYIGSAAQMALIVTFAALVMKVTWGPLPALAAVLLAFALSSVALGTMLGTFVKTENQASGLSIMLGMTFGLLSGCMWPLELFPPAVRSAVHVLPMTWAMEALTGLTMRGEGLRAVLPAVGVLLLSALLFFAVGVRRFRYE